MEVSKAVGINYFVSKYMTHLVVRETKLGLEKDLTSTLMLEQKEEKNSNKSFC